MTQIPYIYDAIRTHRGKGKKDGSLYTVKPVHMAAGLLNELERRHRLDTSRVDDVILGCGQPARRAICPGSRCWKASTCVRSGPTWC